MNEGETGEAQQILSQIQQQLISNLGKVVVVIPPEAQVTTGGDDEEGEE